MLHISERLTLYQFLATLFRYPDAEALQEIRDTISLAAGIVVETPSPPPLSNGQLLKELQIAYTGLFINRLGGAPALPYGSVYLEGEKRLVGESTRRVATAYDAEGLSVQEGDEPPDFLATELEFLYFLLEQEEKALKRQDVAAARATGAKQAGFVQAFLLPWVFTFSDRVQQTPDAHPLYRWGAALLARFFHHERQWLERLS